jgi:hypothetical protein
MPPWCAGATDEEQQKFVGALPVEARKNGIIEARKANRQEGAEQKYEKKVVEKKKNGGQASLF